MSDVHLAVKEELTPVTRVQVQCACGNVRWMNLASAKWRTYKGMDKCIRCCKHRPVRATPAIGSRVHGYLVEKQIGWRYLLTCQTCGDARWLSEASLRARSKPSGWKGMRCNKCK